MTARSRGSAVQSPPQFKTIPLQDELTRVERDLRFHPSTVEHPTTLSREQVDRFNQEGYLKPFRAFSAEEMTEQRAYFDRLLAQVLAEGGSSYSISTANLKYGRVYDLLTHPRIVARVRDLLGEN